MSSTTLTYSHCRPIRYYEYHDNNTTCPTMMSVTYDRVDAGEYDVVTSYDFRLGTNKFFSLIGVQYADETYGILDTTTREDGGKMEVDPCHTDTLRIFPNKEIAMDYLTKVVALHGRS